MRTKRTREHQAQAGTPKPAKGRLFLDNVASGTQSRNGVYTLFRNTVIP
jgi:hypothetical protein